MIRLTTSRRKCDGASAGCQRSSDTRCFASLLSSAPLRVELTCHRRGPAAKVSLKRAKGVEGVARVSCKVYYCEDESLCLFKQLVFEVPLSDSAAAVEAVELEYAVPVAGAGLPTGAGGFSSSSINRIPSFA